MFGRFIYNCMPFCFIFTFAVLPLWLLPAEGKHFKLWDMTMHNLNNFCIILKSAKWAYFLWFQIMTNMPPMANVPVMPNVRHNFFQRMPFLIYFFIYYVLLNTYLFTGAAIWLSSSKYSPANPKCEKKSNYIHNSVNVFSVVYLLDSEHFLNFSQTSHWVFTFSLFQIPSFDANPLPSQDPMQPLQQDQPTQTSQVLINLYITFSVFKFDKGCTAN